MKQTIGVTGGLLIALGCAQRSVDAPLERSGVGGRADGEGVSIVFDDQHFFYRYIREDDVLARSSLNDADTFSHGGHSVVTPVFQDATGREPIDPANRANRLHPELGKDVNMTYQGGLTSGEAEWDVFASTWWPQSKNGVAWRWQRGDSTQDLENLEDRDRLAPIEKYDAFYTPGQTAVVPEQDTWPYKEAKKPESERDQSLKVTRPEITVAGEATRWELQNHGTYQNVVPEGWWGHCNGWASYATTEAGSYPRRDINVKLVDGALKECIGELAGAEGCMLWKMADIEGLMTELYFSDQATFTGRRCSLEPSEIEKNLDDYGRPTNDECRDINAATYHIAVTGLQHETRGAKNFTTNQKQRLAFVIDHTAHWEVWNYPLKSYQIDEEEEIGREEARCEMSSDCSLNGDVCECTNGLTPFNAFDPNATRFIKIAGQYTMISDGVPASKLGLRADARGISPKRVDVRYLLELNGSGEIVGGEWLGLPSYWDQSDDKTKHPDFLWMAVKHNSLREDGDDLGPTYGASDNPYLAYSKIKALLECANDPTTCAPGPIAPPPVGNICQTVWQDFCLGAQTPQGCFCDAACMDSGNGDCCQDGNGTKAGVSDYICQVCGHDFCASEPPPVDLGFCASRDCSEFTGDGEVCQCSPDCSDYSDCCQDDSGARGANSSFVDGLCGR